MIGTLYCANGNCEFGISRIVKSLEPYERKISPDTWYYAKRCFLALGETLAKNMVLLKDEAFDDILAFFDAAASVGKNIHLGEDLTSEGGMDRSKMGSSAGRGGSGGDRLPSGGARNAGDGGTGRGKGSGTPNTVAKEARLLKNFFLKLRD